MMQPLREMMSSFRASPVFALAVLVALGLAGFNGLMFGQMALRRDFYLPGGFGQMTHGAVGPHSVHELTFAFLFVPAVVGMLAQFRRPSKNVAGQLMALIPWYGLVLTLALTLVFTNNTNVLGPQWTGVAAVTFIATILHPAWRDFFRSFGVSRINRVMLALVIIAAVPLLVFAATNIRLQGGVLDAHVFLGHYGFMAAFGFTIIGVGLLASLRFEGWWPTAWVAGLLPALLGITSLVYPDASSSLGLFWALAAIAWGVGFVAAAELTQDAERPTLLGSWGVISTLRGPRGVLSIDDTGVRPAEDRPPGTPVWVNVFGIIVLVPVLLIVLQTLVSIAGGQEGPGAGGQGPGGGGPGLHDPGGNTSSSGATSSGGDHEGNTPPIAGAPELAITGDKLAFSLDRIELGPDQPAVNVVLTSADTLHDLTVDEIGFQLAADRGETVTGGLEGQSFGVPGTYVGYCSVPGHREAGMEIEIVVTGPGGPSQHGP